VTGPIEPERVRAGPSARPLPLASIFIALLPVWLFLFLLVVAPAFLSPLRLNPPSMLGLPLGAVLVAAGLAWSVLGATVIATTTSWAVRLFASVVFTLPALFVVILAPAVVLILSHLGD
jgi:hypothetical protein